MEITRRSPQGERFPSPADRRGSDSADHSMWSAGASPSVAARQLPRGGSDFRPPQIGGDRIPLTTQCGQRGPPPQSLRDSSPAGGAIFERPQIGGDRIPLTTQCGQRGPPPQSLRDSSPAGGPARKSHCSDLPCRWRCHEVKVGSFRYVVRARAEPPSACGISPRRAGGEGKWRLRAGLRGGRDFRVPQIGGDRIPLTTQCGQRGPAPQSLRDSSPAGGAISDLLPAERGGS